MDGAHRTPRRRPTIAKDWQLAVLRKLQSESGNPSEEQRSAAAVETGLDEKWVKNWFIRQRSKNAARNRKNQLTTTEPHKLHAHSATVPTFKLQLYNPGMPSRRSVSTPVDPAPHLPSPASMESPPPRPPSSTANTPRSNRSLSAPVSLNNPSRNQPLVPHTTTTPTYSRDPLCNRYPDFSQFFRPQVHERLHTFELSTPISNHNGLVQLVANPDMTSHAPMHVQDLFNLFNPLHLGGLQSSSTNPQSCPVAFSMRLVDLLGHSSLARYPVFPSP